MSSIVSWRIVSIFRYLIQIELDWYDIIEFIINLNIKINIYQLIRNNKI